MRAEATVYAKINFKDKNFIPLFGLRKIIKGKPHHRRSISLLKILVSCIMVLRKKNRRKMQPN
jgi:hypothetical protein